MKNAEFIRRSRRIRAALNEAIIEASELAQDLIVDDQNYNEAEHLAEALDKANDVFEVFVNMELARRLALKKKCNKRITAPIRPKHFQTGIKGGRN